MGKLVAAFAGGVVVAVVAVVAVVVLQTNDATVPQVVGMTVPQAKREVTDAGLSPKVFNKSDPYAKYFDEDESISSGPVKIVDQSPPAGTEVEEGTTVGLDAGG